jgi:predicted lipopolysaccharide heptosyltransferase III
MKVQNIKKILLIQLGDIGDVVWTTPTLWAVKGSFPRAKIVILVREGIGPLLEGDPSLEKVFEVKHHPGGFLRKGMEEARFLISLRREHFDLVFDLRAGDRGAILAYLTGAPKRVSLLYRKGVPFWRKRLFTHLVDPPPPRERLRGAAEQSLRIVRGLGIACRDTTPKLWVSEKVEKRARDLLQSEKIAGQPRWITVNPFSRWAYKEWGYEKWVEILDWLWDDYKIAAVVVGATTEREKAADIAKKCKGVVFNLAGRTSLDELLGLLSMSSLHLGVDSGPPHIAAAAGAPTITIYGPTDWYDWAPPGKRHRVIVPELECVPCFKKGCNGKEWSRCLEELKAAKVKAVIKDALDQIPVFHKDLEPHFDSQKSFTQDQKAGSTFNTPSK